MQFHQLLGLFSKEFGLTLIALIPLTLVFFRKMYMDYADKKENENIKNVELLVQWFNEHGAPKDKFITEQLVQKRFGFLIDYDVVEWILQQENPSSYFYHYRYTYPYITFDQETQGFICKGEWNKEKLGKKGRLETIRSFISLLLSFGLLATIFFLFAQAGGLDFSISAILASYSIGALLYTGISLNTSMGFKGSVALLDLSESSKDKNSENSLPEKDAEAA